VGSPEADWLAKQALVRVQDAQTGRVRVEDYLTVLAAMTGEAALLTSGVIDREHRPCPGLAGLRGSHQRDLDR
jgi:hypothetical protein